MSDDDDDNPLHDFDLSAWDAPPPPAGLADAVISRLDSPGVAAVAIVESRRSPPWLLISGVTAVAAASIATWALVRSTDPADRGDAPTSGAVVADRARHLSLPGVAAELDLGADVHWRHAGAITQIDQRGGTVTWRVDRDDELVIDVGAMGASIEATGASLRVEDRMNLSDARVIGASALTAAAVAMATVIVYEGAVKVTAAGQTIVVEPGSTVEILPGQPARAPVAALDNVGGGSVTPPTPRTPAVPPVPPVPPVPNTTTPSCDEVTCVISKFAGACCKQFVAAAKRPEPTPDALDRDSIQTAILAAKADIERCGVDHPAKGTVKIAVKVTPDGVASATVKSSPDPDLGACVAGVIGNVRFARTQNGGSFSYPFVFDTAQCDADALKEQGTQHEARGQHAAALSSFERALQCKPDDGTVKLAFMSACNAGNVPKARMYFEQMTPDSRTRLELMCVRNHITHDMLASSAPPPCDAAALKARGSQNAAIGQHAEALGQYEESLRCKPDDSVVKLAFMAACNLDNVPKARTYWQKLTHDDQERLVQLCLRNQISRAQLDAPQVGFLNVTSTPPAKIFVDGTDTGLTTPIAGNKLELSPGKHKVTFLVGNDRFTYNITIKPGETATLSKELQ